jgi:anti-sigma factor RsiW
MAICADYSAMIQLHLDHELTGSDEQEFVAHLENCESCKRELEELKTLSQRIRQARPQVSAPASLRKRILEQAAHRDREKEDQEKEEAPQNTRNAPLQLRKAAGKWRFSKLSWLPMAIAAMVFLAAGASLSIPHLRGQANAESFIDTAITAHRSLTNASMPLDVRSDSSKAVAAWFTARVPFPFRMPNAGMASDDTAKYVLTGGRLMTFGGEQAALLAFQTPDDTVSVLISSGKKAQAKGGKETQSSGITFHSKDRNDLHVVTWENKDLVYALIFPNHPNRKYTCSTCHEGAKASETATLDQSHFTHP